jgi:hypothetical protein
MTIKTTVVGGALAATAALGLTYAVAGQASPRTEAHAGGAVHLEGPQELADFIHATVHYDYEPFATPGLLRQASDVAVLGTVASVESTLLATDAEDVGGVLVSLQVEEVWQEDPSRQGELVTYVIPRPTNVDVAAYREALPVGTRVALFGNQTVETLLTTEPVAGTVYDPAPQGLVFEVGPGRAVNVWGEDVRASGWRDVQSIQELRDAALAG